MFLRVPNSLEEDINVLLTKTKEKTGVHCNPIYAVSSITTPPPKKKN
jgi:hypothetical protein